MIKCSFCAVNDAVMAMRHGTRKDLFGHACKPCHDERLKEGLKGLFVGCSKCNTPMAGKHFTAFPADIPGFFEMLCVACSAERIASENAKGAVIVHDKFPRA